MREELIVLVPDSILSFPHALALSRLAMLAKNLPEEEGMITENMRLL